MGGPGSGPRHGSKRGPHKPGCMCAFHGGRRHAGQGGRKPLKPLSEELILNTDPGRGSWRNNYLKHRLIKEKILKERCLNCGIGPEWHGRRLKLQLHHVDGNRADNRIENLKILCSNCHSQTKTWCGGNKNAYLQTSNKLTENMI